MSGARKLSEVLAGLAEKDGDPEVFNVVVCYETRKGDMSTLYSLTGQQRAFMVSVMEMAAHAANAPGTQH